MQAYLMMEMHVSGIKPLTVGIFSILVGFFVLGPATDSSVSILVSVNTNVSFYY